MRQTGGAAIRRREAESDTVTDPYETWPDKKQEEEMDKNEVMQTAGRGGGRGRQERDGGSRLKNGAGRTRKEASLLGGCQNAAAWQQE